MIEWLIRSDLGEGALRKHMDGNGATFPQLLQGIGQEEEKPWQELNTSR